MLQTGVPALLHWCKQVTSGYPGVSVSDFSSSWRSGLAFCAIIARFRPDLLDFDSLKAKDGFNNCHLAFSVAEARLGIPALLEAKDMVTMGELDTRSIITYLAQYYHKFNKLNPQPALRRSIRKTQDSMLSKDSGLEDSLSDSRHSSPIPNSSRNSSPVSSSSSSRQSSSEDCHGGISKDSSSSSKKQSFPSLPRSKESEKPKQKVLGPKNISFIAALQKFSNLSSSTPNLYKPSPVEEVTTKSRKTYKNNLRTTETQTELVSTSHRAIQTEQMKSAPEANKHNDHLYARSVSISNLYSNAVPNCDKNKANNLLQGLSKYRGSQRILSSNLNLNQGDNNFNSNNNVHYNNRYSSCDTLVKINNINPLHTSPQWEKPKKKYQSGGCCNHADWRSTETIGVYNTKHFEHNQDYCNQRYYEPNPLYGYSASTQQTQGYHSSNRNNHKKVFGREAIYQNTGHRHHHYQYHPGDQQPPHQEHSRIIYNSKNNTFSTLV